MTWTRLGDDDNDRPDHLSVSRSARLLNHEAKVYCNKHTTDGYLPAAALGRITDADDPAGDAAQLVAAGMWELADTGWQIDWSDQESSEEVKARRDFQAAKQKRYRQRKARHERGDHSECDPRFCRAAVTGNETGNGDRNVTGRVTPSLPVPSRPPSGDRDAGPASGSAGATPLRPAGSKCPHGVTNGIRLGQCADDQCVDEWEHLTDCSRGICHVETNLDGERCPSGSCWYRDVWPAERSAS